MRRLSAVAFLIAPLLFLASSASAVSYSPMWGPNARGVQYTAWCTDWVWNGYYWQQVKVPYCLMYISTGAYLNTNAHFHDDPGHLYSSMSPSGYAQADTYGNLNLALNTTLVGQAEFWCVRDTRNGNYSCFDYAVGYTDVYYNDHPEIWLKIGGTDTGANTGHGSTAYNRYMMSVPAYHVYDATYAYFANHPGQDHVCTNDMALPFGGKFDISSSSRWRSPHFWHDRGSAVDVAGPTSGQCPAAYQVNVAEFIARCIDNFALSAYSINESNHAHCDWINPNTYPH